MFNDYDIRNKLKYIIINNVDINNTLIKTITNVLREKKMLYNSLQRRLRCNNYIINLKI